MKPKLAAKPRRLSSSSYGSQDEFNTEAARSFSRQSSIEVNGIELIGAEDERKQIIKSMKVSSL